MKLNLEGKVVLVTGGTKGIGRAIVEGLYFSLLVPLPHPSRLTRSTSLSEGAQVFFCSRTESDVHRANNELVSQFTKSRAEGAVVDVTRSEEVGEWVQGIVAKRGRIDVLVSNVSSLSVTDESGSWKNAYDTEYALQNLAIYSIVCVS